MDTANPSLSSICPLIYIFVFIKIIIIGWEITGLNQRKPVNLAYVVLVRCVLLC